MNKLFKSKVPPFFVGLALLFLAGFALTMWMAYFVPIYSDESEWKLIGARMLLDGGKLLYLFPACNASQWIDIPLTWYPARLLDALIYQDASNPWQLRNISWTVFVVLLAAWTAIIRITSRLSLASSGLFATSFFSVGVLPFLMVFNRPEQCLLTWLTIALLTMLWFERNPVKGSRGRFLLTAFFALLACLLAAAHPKGLFFFLVLIVAWWRLVKSLPLGLVLAGVMAWTALETTRVWQLRTVCAESPWLTKILQSLTLQPQQLWQDPQGFVRAGQANLAAVDTYVRGIQFQQDYQSQWLPATEHVSSSFLIDVLINALTWLPLAVAGILIPVNLGRQLWKRQAGWPLLSVALAAALLALIFLQSNKNFYEAGIVWPVVLLICAFSFTPVEGEPNRMVRNLLLPLMLAGASLAAYVRYDVFWEHAQQWRADRTRSPSDIAWLRSFGSEQCSIDDAAENLVLDRSTYPAFWQHRRPMFLPYITGWWATGTDYVTTLTKQNPGGLVSLCQSMPPDLAKIVVERRGYCCASRIELRQFTEKMNPAGAGQTP